jgi:hypothetical protein
MRSFTRLFPRRNPLSKVPKPRDLGIQNCRVHGYPATPIIAFLVDYIYILVMKKETRRASSEEEKKGLEPSVHVKQGKKGSEKKAEEQ